MIKSIDHFGGFRSRLRVVDLLSEIDGNRLVSSAGNPKQGNLQATRRFNVVPDIRQFENDLLGRTATNSDVTQRRERARNDDAVRRGLAVRRCVKHWTAAERVAEQAAAGGSGKNGQERVKRRDAILVDVVDRSGRTASAVPRIVEH